MIMSCPNIENLDIRKNVKFYKIIPYIGNLMHLKSLKICCEDQNRICNGVNLIMLENVEELHLSLQSLHFEDNYFTEIMQCFPNIKNLSLIEVLGQNDQSTYIEHLLLTVPKLEKLYIKGSNKFSIHPPSIEFLDSSSLRSLKIEYNHWTSLDYLKAYFNLSRVQLTIIKN